MTLAKDQYLRRRDKYVKNFLVFADPIKGIRSILKKHFNVDQNDLSGLLISKDFWNPLMVPLQISTISLLEVYFEEVFLESIVNKNYTEARDLFKISSELELVYSKFPNIDKSQVNKRFSFQRLDQVDYLFFHAFQFKINSFKYFDVLKFNCKIRHQFAHDCAKVTTEFIEIHNDFFKDIPAKHLGVGALGKDLFREPHTLESLLSLLDDFIDFVENGVHSFSL